VWDGKNEFRDLAESTGIPRTVPIIEKVKASFNAMLLLMMIFVIFQFFSKAAFSHAVKANFWACDDVYLR